MSRQDAERGSRPIRVSIDRVDPLSGAAKMEGGEELRFEGWLGLLDVLSVLVASGGRPAGERLEDDGS